MNKLALYLLSFSIPFLMEHYKTISNLQKGKAPEKYALSKQYLKKYGINPYHFSAVNGWKLSI